MSLYATLAVAAVFDVEEFSHKKHLNDGGEKNNKNLNQRPVLDVSVIIHN